MALSHRVLSRGILVTGLTLAVGIAAQPAKAQISGFSSGFTLNHGGDATHKGSGGDGGNGPAIAANVLTITDLNSSEANSAIYGTKQSITAFNASFTYQDVGGGGGNGFSFFVENAPEGTAALGGRGNGLGYGSDDSGGRSPNFIAKSAAVGFNVYTGNSEVAGTHFVTAGAAGAAMGNIFTPTGAVNLGSGDAIAVALNYNGTTLSETLTDANTSTTYSTSYTTDLVSLVGSTAFVGFAGGTGGATVDQTISNFTFSAPPPAVPEQSSAVGLGLGLLGLSLVVRCARKKKASA